MSIEDVLKAEFKLLAEELIELYDKKGMRASGKFADDTEVKTSELSAQLLSAQHAQQLETGRKAGRFPPIKMIEQWITSKGVFNEALRKIKISSLAFLIARKIARSGWNRSENGGVNLISEVVTDERIQTIIDKVGEVSLTLYTSEIEGLIKELQEI